MTTLRCAAALALLSASCSFEPAAAPAGAPGGPWRAPPTRADAAVVDDYHGTEVADPYRWLEDQDGAEVAAWAAAQNRATRAVLDAVPGRAAIRARLEQLWNHERWTPPVAAGGRWFFTRNDGLQDQPVLYVADRPDGDGRVLLDPNLLSAEGTVALSGLALDEQGTHVAYATSAAGSDWRTWRVLEVDSGRTLPDEVQWSKFSGAAFTHDGRGFFYQRYPEPESGATFEAPNTQPRLCYHVLGTPQGEDRVVYERPDEPDWGFRPQVTDDGRFLVVTIVAGTDRRKRVAYVDLAQPDWDVRPLRMEFDADWDFLGNQEDLFFFRTDKDAPRGRIVALDRRDPQATVIELVPEARSALAGARRVGDTFVCSYLSDASSLVLRHGLDGAPLGPIPLPALGTAGGFTGDRDSTATFFTFHTFTAPPAVWCFDLGTGTLTPFRVPVLPGGDAADLVSERVFLQSQDGARLCMFLVHSKGLRLDGSAPCYLWGYGGFGIPVTPRFSVPNLVWVERGGIYAQAVLRGGGEYGEDWHAAGMLGNKQNVFDDFVACARYLVRNGYTSHGRLAIGGRSNGGLLVGAVLTQHPHLVGAAVPEVGVMDMLRYHRFTIGRAWAPEYGRSDDAEQFAWLHRYSPLHNVRAAVYPPTLVMTGDHDDRVLPGHSYKFAATLQQAQQGPAPVLLRVETDAGHGAGTPLGKLIDEAADRLAFLELAVGGG